MLFRLLWSEWRDSNSRHPGPKALHEVEALARILLPQIQAFFESEEGQKEFAEWKEKQQSEQ